MSFICQLFSDRKRRRKLRKKRMMQLLKNMAFVLSMDMRKKSETFVLNLPVSGWKMIGKREVYMKV